jgi:hypothetical protein
MAWWVEVPEIGSSSPATILQSAVNPKGAIGPYATKALAQAEANRYNNAFGLSTNPLKAAIQVATGKTSSSSANQPLIQLLPALFTQRGFVLRVVEVILGGTLILVGVSALISDSDVGTVITTAAKAAAA